VTFPHVVLAAYMTGGAFVVGVAAWLYVRKEHVADQALHRKAIRIGAIVALVAGLGVAITGDAQGKIMTEVQPMKMAVAEALYESEQPASFSIFTIGTPDGTSEKFAIKIPNLLSFLATGTWDGKVEGINDLRATYEKEFGQDPGAAYYTAGDYVPNIPVTYWTFRFMIGVGLLTAAGAALILWLTRKGRTPTSGWFGLMALSVPVLAVSGSSFGWIFTEMGRQPWAVFGLMTTANGVSPSVSTFEAATSVIVLTVLYGVLAVIELGLMARYIRKGAEPFVEPPDPDIRGPQDDDQPLTFAY